MFVVVALSYQLSMSVIHNLASIHGGDSQLGFGISMVSAPTVPCLLFAISQLATLKYIVVFPCWWVPYKWGHPDSRENPNLKWMMVLWGTPILGNPHWLVTICSLAAEIPDYGSVTSQAIRCDQYISVKLDHVSIA